MQQTSGVAVLATQLALTDRRALSEAWYQSLRLAERRPAPASPSRAASRAPRRGTPGAPAAAPARRGAPALGARAVTVPGRLRDTPPAGGGERRAAKSALGTRLERALRRGAPRGKASFALVAADGRVRVLLRGDGTRIRLVALCAPALRARVGRALAEARYALALRGIAAAS